MNEPATDRDQGDEEILAHDVSDEALETAAAGAGPEKTLHDPGCC